MHAIHPVGSPLLWLRVLAAAALIVVLPGYLIAGRHFGGGRLARFVCSVSMGWLATTVVARLVNLAGIPVLPWTVAPTVMLLGLGLGRWTTWRQVWSRVAAGLNPTSAKVTAALLAVTACWLVMLVFVRHDFVVPAGRDDASNHVYLVAHIAETGNLDLGPMLTTPFGTLLKGYLVGWHTGAALVATASGVAPYVVMWLLVLATLATFPLAMSLLWRAFPVPGPLIVLGACWLLTDAFMPGGILGWGGYGQLMGMAQVPLATLMVAAMLRDRTLALAATTGIVLGALIHVHASEVVVAVGLGLVVWGGRSREQDQPAPARRAVWPAIVVAVVVTALVAGPEVWTLTRVYNSSIPFQTMSPRETPASAVRRLLGAAGGPDLRQAAMVLGLGLGLASARLRRLAVVSLILGGFYLVLAIFRDPVTTLLSRPFYSQAPRILYLQAYVLPPLLGLSLTGLWSLRARPRWGRPAAVLAALLAAAWFGSGLLKTVGDLRAARATATFVEADYRHAVEVASLVEPDAIIANRALDGGVWAMHVSGRQGTMPHSWLRILADGSPLPERLDDLAREPWPDGVRVLQEAGVTYLYVNDAVDPRDSNSPLRRPSIDADARFEPVLVGETATLYRIHWTAP